MSASPGARSVADALVNAVVMLGPDGAVREWDSRASRLTGYDDEVIGGPFRRLVADGSLAVYDQLVLAAAMGRPPPAQRIRLRHRDGHGLDVEMTLVTVDGAGGGSSVTHAAVLRATGKRMESKAETGGPLRLEQAMERRRSAMADLRAAVVSGSGCSDVMDRVTHHAVDVLEACAAAVWEVGPDDQRRPGIVASATTEAPSEMDRLREVEARAGLLEQVSARNESVILGEARTDDDTDLLGARGGSAWPVLGAPIRHAGSLWGLLMVVRDSGQRAFGASDVETAEGLTSMAGLALDLATERSQHDRLVIYEERKRIAGELHDRVVQDLFALGLNLSGARHIVPSRPADASVELDQCLALAVDEIDNIMAVLRASIFALRHDVADTAADRR